MSNRELQYELRTITKYIEKKHTGAGITQKMPENDAEIKSLVLAA